MTDKLKTFIPSQIPSSQTDAFTDFLKHIRLGNHKLAGKNYGGAITEYTIAIQLEPNNYQGYLCRGNVMLEIENFDAAILDYIKAIYLNPYNCEARDMYETAVNRSDYHKGLSNNLEGLVFTIPYWCNGVKSYITVGSNKKTKKKEYASDDLGLRPQFIKDTNTRAM